jgi:5-oxoprolinase (ATP-hydrolysing) subunit A
MGATMDLNADLGEGFGAWACADDESLLKLVTSANVACGFHAGDPGAMRAVCASAVGRGVAIGAHVGYRDLAGFGRRHIAYRADELADDVLYQLAALDGIARTTGSWVAYVKPHGALYHTALDDLVQAGAVVAAVCSYSRDLAMLCMPDTALARSAEAAGLRVVSEAFADRAYLPSGRLVDRGVPGAVRTDPDDVAERAVRMAVDGEVVAVDGTRVAVAPESLCVHGDTPGAVALAARVRAALAEAGVPLAPFAPVAALVGGGC